MQEFDDRHDAERAADEHDLGGGGELVAVDRPRLDRRDRQVVVVGGLVFVWWAVWVVWLCV